MYITVKINIIINKNDLNGLKFIKADNASPENAYPNLSFRNIPLTSFINDVGNRSLQLHKLTSLPSMSS